MSSMSMGPPQPLSVELVPKGWFTIADISAATGLTVPAGARCAFIQIEDNDARWRDDGTSPTNAVGILVDISVSPDGFWYFGNLSGIEFIEAVATATASVNVCFYGW